MWAEVIAVFVTLVEKTYDVRHRRVFRRKLEKEKQDIVVALRQKIEDARRCDDLRTNGLLTIFKIQSALRRAENHICTRGATCAIRRELCNVRPQQQLALNQATALTTPVDELRRNPDAAVVYWDQLQGAVRGAADEYRDRFTNAGMIRLASQFGIIDGKETGIFDQASTRLLTQLSHLADLVDHQKMATPEHMILIQTTFREIDLAMQDLLPRLAGATELLTVLTTKTEQLAH